MPPDLKLSRLLPGSLHLDKTDLSSGHQYNSVRHSVHPGRDKLRTNASRISHRLDQSRLDLLLSHRCHRSHSNAGDFLLMQ